MVQPILFGRVENENLGNKTMQKILAFGLIFAYIYIMKSSKKSKLDKSKREEILKSLMASFKIEGIDIPAQVAAAALKKLDLNPGK